MSLFGLFAMLTVVVMVGIRPSVRHPHSFCAGNADLVLRAERCFVGLSQEVLIVHKSENPEISAIALDDSFIVRLRKFIQSERAAFLNRSVWLNHAARHTTKTSIGPIRIIRNLRKVGSNVNGCGLLPKLRVLN
jgi:hypothetical protein